MMWIVYFVFTGLAALMGTLVLVGVLEPLAGLLSRKPLWISLLICLSLPFAIAVLLSIGYGLTVRQGPTSIYGGGFGAMVMAVSGFAGGALLGLLLLVGRWSARFMVVAVILAGSLAWCLGGVNMFYACEAILPAALLKILVGAPYLAGDYTHGHSIMAGLTVASVSLLTARGVWRSRDRRPTSDD